MAHDIGPLKQLTRLVCGSPEETGGLAGGAAVPSSLRRADLDKVGEDTEDDMAGILSLRSSTLCLSRALTDTVRNL